MQILDLLERSGTLVKLAVQAIELFELLAQPSDAILKLGQEFPCLTTEPSRLGSGSYPVAGLSYQPLGLPLEPLHRVTNLTKRLPDGRHETS
jgi:hypothetical protein